MKKLMTILVVFAMCGVAMAANPRATDDATVQIPLTTGKHNYINYQRNGQLGSSGLTYTVTNSTTGFTRYYTETVTDTSNIIDYREEYNYRTHKWEKVPVYGTQEIKVPAPSYYNDYTHTAGQLYFTTGSKEQLDAYNQAKGENMTKYVVQFAGTQMDKGTNDMVKDYGIYLYDPKNTDAPRTYLSVNSDTAVNHFELDPDKTFGVYYVNQDGQYITTTENWVGNFDKGNNEDKAGTNKIIEYDEEHPDGNPTYTYKKFMCLLTSDDPYLNDIIHWEFMLQTMLDNPYYNVHSEDFTGNGDTFNNDDAPNGQPLPGTLATLLIGGLCAGSLRKRNKK